MAAICLLPAANCCRFDLAKGLAGFSGHAHETSVALLSGKEGSGCSLGERRSGRYRVKGSVAYPAAAERVGRRTSRGFTSSCYAHGRVAAEWSVALREGGQLGQTAAGCFASLFLCFTLRSCWCGPRRGPGRQQCRPVSRQSVSPVGRVPFWKVWLSAPVLKSGREGCSGRHVQWRVFH